ncbi:AMP-binding protein [Pontibacter sp. G13]|uniref:AMP-binding protein n=1 Tax=Pontibacter sp. G13 TaxID=3074898 RepID=UPI00288C61C3|nr:AMP-binding protein [Pontibacter sp. G13]WNJ17836.1 AMP-binding protein [Pontibacter sp. G13]
MAKSPVTLDAPVDLQDANVVHLFLRQASRHGDRIALIDRDGTQISYRTLADQIRQTASAFHRKGVRRGDRMLVFIPMSIDLYRTVLALFYLGATAVFLDEWVSIKRLSICCDLVKCRGLIAGAKLRFVAWWLPPLRRLAIRIGSEYAQSETPHPASAEVSSEDTALITFTTGSTGIPKAADRTHAFLNAQFEALFSEIQPKAGEVAMPALPIVLLINLAAGATSVIADVPATQPHRMKPEKVARQLRDHQVKRLTCSPLLVDRLATWAINSQEAFPDLKQIFTGGAPVFPEMAARFKRAFPHADIRVAYGSTEAEPISLATVGQVLEYDLPGKGLCVGHIHKRTKLSIQPVDDQAWPSLTSQEWKNRELKAGQVGEIVVAGPHVLTRYIDNPEAWNRQKVRVGQQIWHRTGDAGFISASGLLYLVGRCNQLIETSEYMIAPFVVESQLSALLGISVGTVLELNGEIWIAVECAKELPAQTLEAMKSIIPSSAGYLSLQTIPRDPRHQGKIDYGKLSQHLVKHIGKAHRWNR